MNTTPGDGFHSGLLVGPNSLSVEELAAAVLALPMEDRVRLMGLIIRGGEGTGD